MELPALATRVLDEARAMTVAVASTHGPHVTPELFVVAEGRLWSLTAAGALKVRVLRRRGRAGVLVRSGDDAVVLSATVTVLDVARPLDALASGVALDVPRVLATFAARHALEMAGGAADVATGRFGLVPDRWVLLSFDVDAIAVVRGAQVLEASGWDDGHVAQEAGGDDDGNEPALALAELPEALRPLPARPYAALGWTAPVGPVALPATWTLATTTAAVPVSVWSAVRCDEQGRAAVTFDEWTGPGPTGKRGVMLRGAGHTSIVDDDVHVAVDVERAVVWDGVDTDSLVGIRPSTSDPDQTADIRDPNKDPKKESRAG